MRTTSILLLSLLLVLPTVAAQGSGASATNEAPRVHEIKAVLEPPFTYYSIEALDPELAQLSFEWTITGNGRCDDFRSEGATAQWRHDDEERCPHDAAAHPALITVVVTDGTTRITRTYAGGSAGFDPGEPDWRTTDTSFFGGNEEGDDPRDFPFPTAYGEDLDCAAREASGLFEPVQAVWQDEDTPRFPDLPGKQLTITSTRSANAELPLVVAKHTQLFGTRSDRAHIYYNGSVTGTDRVPAVVRWSMTDAMGKRVLGEKDVGDMFLGGDRCGAPTPFAFTFDTTLGLEIRHFLPRAPGAYTLTMELAERGGGAVPGSEVTIQGTAKRVHEPRVYFVGTIVSNASAPGALAAATRTIADASARNIPDFFPLPPGGFKAIYRPTDRDARDAVARGMERCTGNLSAFDWCRVNAARSAVESLFAGSAWTLRTTSGESLSVDRIAVVVSRADMDGFLYPPADSANGFAANTKTFFQHANTSHYTTAHEFAHTVPGYAWLHPAPDDCTVAYHNTGTGLGHGFQLTQQGSPVRIPQGPKHGLMQGGAADRWIEQCTYEHILGALDSLTDPRLVGLRGWIARDGAFEAGGFEPGMTFDGIPDPGAPAGEYEVSLYDAGGMLLASHPFAHPFTDDNGRATPMVAWSMAVERPEGLARIDLVGPSGVLATRVVTPSAPTLDVAVPAALPTGGRPLALSWTASDPDGDALTYGVAFSPDEGETWYDVGWDLETTSVEVPAEFLALGAAPRVRIIATDGVNSAEVERPIGERPPPGSTPPAGGAPGATAGPEDGDARGQPGPGVVGAVGVLAVAALVRTLRRREG